MSKRPRTTEDGMRREYDFSVGIRGKFHSSDAALVPPVHLDIEILRWLQARAEARGTTVNQLVNDLLRKDIELIETVR